MYVLPNGIINKMANIIIYFKTIFKVQNKILYYNYYHFNDKLYDYNIVFVYNSILLQFVSSSH